MPASSQQPSRIYNNFIFFHSTTRLTTHTSCLVATATACAFRDGGQSSPSRTHHTPSQVDCRPRHLTCALPSTRRCALLSLGLPTREMLLLLHGNHSKPHSQFQSSPPPPRTPPPPDNSQKGGFSMLFPHPSLPLPVARKDSSPSPSHPTSQPASLPAC